MPIGAVYCGRPTRWGNPFSHKPSQVDRVIRVATREDAIREYRTWIMADAQTQLRDDMKIELRGKDLSCWCKPEACHIEIILEIANS